VKTVARRVERMQETFDRHVGQMATTAMVILFVVACALRCLGPRHDEAAPRHTPEVTEPAPAPRGQTLAVPDATRARALRHEALSACRAQQWSTCETRLDQADEIDPGGAGDPEAQEARDMIDGKGSKRAPR